MQESAMRRIATVEGIQFSVNNLSELVRNQSSLTGMEIGEGLSSLIRGIGVLAVGLAGLVLMALALIIAAVLALSLISARVAFFLMAKSYQRVDALESRLHSWPTKALAEDGASHDFREAA